MIKYFKTKKEAQDFVSEQTKAWQKIESNVIQMLSEDIIDQEHFTFYDFEFNKKYNVSIQQTIEGFKTEIVFKKQNKLVFAAEIGDFDLFKSEYQKGNSIEALSLAFCISIYKDKINILNFFFEQDLVKDLNLFQSPLIVSVATDSLLSFLYLMEKEIDIPTEILTYIFQDNAKKILFHIIDNDDLSDRILLDKYLTERALKILNKPTKENEAIRIYKTYNRNSK